MITITDFYTKKCSPCKQMLAVLDEIETNYDDVQLIKIDCEENLEMAIENGVRSVPVIILQSDKGSKRFQGLQSLNTIVQAIEELR